MNFSEVRDPERTVTSLIDAGQTTEAVEATEAVEVAIDLPSTSDEDRRAALWLLGWASSELRPVTNSAASRRLETPPVG